ncbi:L-threonylcarbamoyladenylate synthase [Saezia sanguinis]|uniref:L-threonylcarbamoyladenylate synthase n=1 Tax=Saezia sanguinis TaxID=1965230 RepID=UPI00302F9B8C
MALHIYIHPQDPQPRLIRQAVQMLRDGDVLAIPTDTSYALVCQLDDKNAVDHMRQIRGLDAKQHPFSLLCADLSQLASYAKVDNRQYRLLKLGTPGPFTFILEATKDVPRRVSHPQRRTIGLRVPGMRVTQALLDEMGEPLLATTLIPPGETDALNDAQEIAEQFAHQIQAVLDAGACPSEPSTVIDLSQGDPVLVRRGLGDPAQLGLQLDD